MVAPPGSAWFASTVNVEHRAFGGASGGHVRSASVASPGAGRVVGDSVVAGSVVAGSVVCTAVLARSVVAGSVVPAAVVAGSVVVTDERSSSPLEHAATHTSTTSAAPRPTA